MVTFISKWAEGIIVAVIIATILEMILPEGNNKKYIKVVIGIYILFTIVSPIIQKITKQEVQVSTEEWDSYFKNEDTYQQMSNSFGNSNNYHIEEVFMANLKEDMTTKLKNKGYEASNIVLELELKKEEDYGKIKQVSLDAKKQKQQEEQKAENIISINQVKISTTNSITETKEEKKKMLTSQEIKEIKTFLNQEYEVSEKNIKINE